MALGIIVVCLTLLTSITLPWGGWSSGADAAGRGMAIFFPSILMLARVSCVMAGVIALAADGDLAWTGLSPVAAAVAVVLCLGTMGGVSFFSVTLLLEEPTAPGRASTAFLAAIAFPASLAIWLLAERYSADGSAQVWLVRVLAASLALASLPFLLHSLKMRQKASAQLQSEQARQESEAIARASQLPETATLDEILAFLDGLGQEEYRAIEIVTARATHFPEASERVLELLGSPDRDVRLRAAFHSSQFSLPASPAYFALVRPEIEAIIERLRSGAAEPAVLYREALAAIRMAWPAINNDGLPKSLMVELFEAISAQSDEDRFNGVQHDAKMLAEYVTG